MALSGCCLICKFFRSDSDHLTSTFSQGPLKAARAGGHTRGGGGQGLQQQQQEVEVTGRQWEEIADNCSGAISGRHRNQVCSVGREEDEANGEKEI